MAKGILKAVFSICSGGDCNGGVVAKNGTLSLGLMLS